MPDAVIVGAGLTGSWVARELSSGGLNVALVDAGPLLPAELFSADRNRARPFDIRFNLFRLKLLLKGDVDRAFNKFVTSRTHKLFLDRHQHPYITPEGRDFHWSRVRAIGGRGHLWGRVMLRVTNSQLSTPGFEWPIRYQDLAPYYDEVEQVLELGGAPSNIPEVPDGRYVHQRTFHPLEQRFYEAVLKQWPSMRAVVNHVAQYEPAPLSPMLKAADWDRLTLYPNTTVAQLAVDRKGSVTGVEAISSERGGAFSIKAPVVVLCASAFETVKILLNSRSDFFPAGIGNSHGLLGTRILEHIVASVFARLPKKLVSKRASYFHDPLKLNSEPHGFYIPFPNRQERDSSQPSFGYGVQGSISTETGLFYLGAFGEMKPSDDNRITLDHNKLDRSGVPLASINFKWSEADLELWRQAELSLHEMVSAFESDTGIKLENPLTKRLYSRISGIGPPVPGSNHECGGARMGSDPSESVVDPYNRIWEAPNVLVCDSACFPTIPHQNPTLTTMALAVRASRRLLAGGP